MVPTHLFLLFLQPFYCVRSDIKECSGKSMTLMSLTEVKLNPLSCFKGKIPLFL